MKQFCDASKVALLLLSWSERIATIIAEKTNGWVF